MYCPWLSCIWWELQCSSPGKSLVTLLIEEALGWRGVFGRKMTHSWCHGCGRWKGWGSSTPRFSARVFSCLGAKGKGRQMPASFNLSSGLATCSTSQENLHILHTYSLLTSAWQCSRKEHPASLPLDDAFTRRANEICRNEKRGRTKAVCNDADKMHTQKNSEKKKKDLLL